MSGGSEKDVFICGDGVDTITDFNSRSDAKSSDREDV
jgi:hypothetical protein